jgi:stage IV sporulation protein FB
MKLGRVEVTGSFLLFVAWMNYLDRQGIVPLAMLACLLHELGHLAVLHWLEIDVKRIRLTAIGAEIVMTEGMSYGQEAAAAFAGPGVNLLLALLFSGLEWGKLFAGLNLVLGCFNLLPIGGLDGGRVLRCGLVFLVGADLAETIGRIFDVGLTAFLLAFGVFLAVSGCNISLFLVSVWLTAVFLSKKN